MTPPLAAVVLAVQLQTSTPVVAPDWALNKPVARDVAIQAAIRAVLDEDRAKDPEQQLRHETDTLRGGAYQRFVDGIEEARVPDCLHKDGLKRQTTLIFSGLLALPFVAVAKLRGKCK